MEEIITNTINSKEQIYSLVLISIWALTFLVNFIVALIIKGNKKKWGDFWVIWSLTAIISGILLTFLVMAPDQVLNLFNYIKDFIQKIFY